MSCAKSHLTTECPYTKDKKQPAVFTCFNCKQAGEQRTDHAANDVRCPLRQKYLEIRQRATSAQTKRATIVRPRRRSVHEHSSYPHHNAPNQQTNNQTYAGAVTNEGSNIFNIDELFNIFATALDDLSRCTSKVQQIQVVMSLIKYAYDFK